MANFNSMKLTQQGLHMQTQLQFGGAITFTKIAVGDGKLPANADMTSLTGLVSPVDADISIVGNKILSNGKINLKARLKSGKRSFYMREIGIYARFNNYAPVLYAYGYSGDMADFIPAAGGATYIVQDLNLITVIGNAENVSANVTAEIGVERAEFDAHLIDDDNPHKVTKAQLGLGNVDNTSDANKPVSTAAQTALNGKVDKISGKGLSTNDYTTSEKNKLAGIAEGAEVNVQSDWNVTNTNSDAYIQNKPSIPTKVSELINDSGYITQSNIVNKVDKVSGKGLSTNDYTTDEKNKLAGIENNANKYVHPQAHNAGMIIQDSTHRFVTDSEKTAWNAKPFSGSCDTVHGNTSKIVDCPEFKLYDGARIAVVFANGNTAEYMTLNVNNTGAVVAWFPIGSSRAYNNPLISKILVGGCAYEFVYQGGSNPKWVYCGATNIPADGSVSESSIKDGSVTNAKLANGSITGNKIADGTILKSKLSSDIFSALEARISALENKINLLADSCTITFSVRHSYMSSSGDENSHGFMSVDSASGTWSDGSKAVFASLEQDSVCGDLVSYAVFKVNSDKSINIRLYSYENSITIPDEWGANYIEIQPMLSASYSAKIYTR